MVHNNQTYRQIICDLKQREGYLVTLGLIRQFFREGKMDITLAEKLNRKNAEELACDCIPIA